MTWLREHIASFAIVVSVMTALLVFTGMGSAVASNIQSVLIANSSSQPVPTRDQPTAPFLVNGGGNGQPGQSQIGGQAANGLTTGSAEIHQISMFLILPSTEGVATCAAINVTTSQAAYVPMVLQDNHVGGSSTYVGNLPLQMHVAAGDLLSASCTRDGTDGTWQLQYTMAGNLLPS